MRAELRTFVLVLTNPARAFAALSSRRLCGMSVVLLLYFALTKATRRGLLGGLQDIADSWSIGVLLLCLLAAGATIVGAAVIKGIARLAGRRLSLYRIINITAFAQVPRFLLSLVLSALLWILPMSTRQALLVNQKSGVWLAVAVVGLAVLVYCLGLMVYGLAQPVPDEAETCPPGTGIARLDTIVYWIASISSLLQAAVIGAISPVALPWLGCAYSDATICLRVLPAPAVFVGTHPVALCLLLGIVVPGILFVIRRYDRSAGRRRRLVAGILVLLVTGYCCLAESVLVPYLEYRSITALASHPLPEAAALLQARLAEMPDLGDAVQHDGTVDIRVGDVEVAVSTTVVSRMAGNPYLGHVRECTIRFDTAVRGMSCSMRDSFGFGEGDTDSEAYAKGIDSWLGKIGIPLLRAIGGAEPEVEAEGYRFYMGIGDRDLRDNPEMAESLLRALAPHLGELPSGVSLILLHAASRGLDGRPMARCLINGQEDEELGELVMSVYRSHFRDLMIQQVLVVVPDRQP